MSSLRDSGMMHRDHRFEFARLLASSTDFSEVPLKFRLSHLP